MAEYNNVIKQFNRMCNLMTRMIRCTRGECPMGYAFGCASIGQCRKIAFERPDEFERCIMAWAAEHPEQVYPAWHDWLRSQYPMMGPYTMTDILESPIPADIAQKLGIQPKEETP